ncbi:MAG: DUF3592 domain-containing protein [Oscillospiraceae bacterium]|nr:DUF3592 domain-containing protein [Oscillospiraceae bacterium]
MDIKAILQTDKLLSPLAFLAALVILITGVVSLVGSYSRKSGLVKASAVLVYYMDEENTDKDGRTTTVYYPVVEFTDSSGELVRARGEAPSSFQTYTAGHKLNILYNPQSPTSFEPDEVRSRVALPIAMLIFALLLITFGVFRLRAAAQFVKEEFTHPNETEASHE